MPAELTMAVAQPVCVPYNVAANADQHRLAIEQASADVVVFPELSLTGYHFGAEPVRPDDARLQPIISACATTDTLALIGAPVADDDGRRYIAFLAVDGAGVAVAYRKMNLGSEEAKHFAPGSTPTVLEHNGWRLGLAICKDTGVSNHGTITAGLGIDIYVAGVLEHQDDADVQASRADRITSEHDVWVAVASFAGSSGEGFDQAAGGSTIWRPDGTTAASAGTEPGVVVSATLS